MKKLIITTLIIFLLPSICLSDISGKVSKVSDGDTIWILQDNKKIKVRLLGIDAPEMNQDFGKNSQEILHNLIANRMVTIIGNKQDRYQRLIGKVSFEGKDINLLMVMHGAAWHYKKYQSDQSQQDQILYANEELKARQEQKGLWQNLNPVPPWEWRKRKH